MSDVTTPSTRAETRSTSTGEASHNLAVEHLARMALTRLADRAPATARLSPEFVQSFSRLLMAGKTDTAMRILRSMTRLRADYHKIADGVLANAAREMGEMWARDEVTFVEVGVGTGQIIRLYREFGRKYTPLVREADRRNGLFVTLPGQAHNLGIILATEAFRSQDWSIALRLDMPQREIAALALRLRPMVIGLTIGIEDRHHMTVHLARQLVSLPFKPTVLIGGRCAPKAVAAFQPTLRHRVRLVTDIRSALAAI